MFKIGKQNKEVKSGKSSNNFKELITDVLFINKNTNKLEFIHNKMLSKPSLKGIVYFANSQLLLSEIKDIHYITDKIEVLDMLHIFNDNEMMDIYQSAYKSHFITESSINVQFKDGKNLELLF